MTLNYLFRGDNVKNFFFKGSVVDKLLRCALISKALLHLQVLSPKKKNFLD